MLERFFDPDGVAVVGASARPGKIGHEVLRSVALSAYAGPVYPINPAAAGRELFGRRVLASVSDIPGRADLAVIAVAAEKVPGAVEECARAGIGAAVVISGGFKELGEAGALLERRAVEAARAGGLRIIGPNCIGISSSSSGLETFFQPPEMMARPGPGPVAVVSQSGTFGATILEWFAEEGLGLSRFASLGNKSDVDEVDLVRYLADDPATGMVLLYIEGLPRAREFARLASEVGPRKPLLLLKGGRTAAGARAARSHTGSLSGDHRSFEGAMAQSGVLLALDSDHLFDTAKLLALQPLPAGGRVTMVTNGAGPCVLASDLISESGHLSLAEPGPAAFSRLRELLPDFCVITSTVDLTGSADAASFRSSLEVLMDDPASDILLPVFVFQDAPLGLTAPKLVEDMTGLNVRKKTILAVAGGGPFTRESSLKLQGVGVPVYPTATRAVRALEAASRHSAWRRGLGAPPKV